MRRNRLCIALIIIAHLIWFIGALIWKHIYNGDSLEYFSLADNLKHGLYYASDASKPIEPFYISLRTPLYSFYIIIVQFLFGKHDWILLLFQNILSVCNCMLALKIFRNFLNAKHAWIYWFLILCYPAQMIFSSMIVPDIWLQLFTTLYLYHLIKFVQEKSPKYVYLSSLWLILAFLTKPIVYPFFIVHIFMAGYFLLKNKKTALLPIVFAPLCFLIGYGLFIKSKTGFYHYSSVQAHNLLDYNVRGFHEYRYGIATAQKINDSAHLIINNEPDFKSQYQKTESMAKDTIKNNAASYAIFHVIKSAKYFIEPGKGEIDLFTGYNTYDNIFSGKSESFYTQYEKDGIKGAWNYIKHYPWLPLIVLIFLFNIIRTFGFLTFIFSKNIPLYFRLIIAIFVGYFAIVTGPVSNFTRYYLPVLCITSACAAISFGNMIDKRKGKRKPVKLSTI